MRSDVSGTWRDMDIMYHDVLYVASRVEFIKVVAVIKVLQ